MKGADMLVNGCDCSIVIKTSNQEMSVPYSNETIRESVLFLLEEASIEGNGICKGIRKSGGVTGCVVTPLTIGTAPLLLYLALGSSESPVFVTQTRNVYLYFLCLTSLEDSENFSLIQERANNSEQIISNKERKVYEGCGVSGFELRIMRGESIKLKLEICGDCPPRNFPYTDTAQRQTSEMSSSVIGNERFSGDFVTYKVNGQEYKNIYGVTISVKKENGTKTELLIKRALEQGGDLPEVIKELTITARLLRNKYEYRHFGTLRITLFNLFSLSDETEIVAADTVIGPVRYYCAGSVFAEVFTSGNEVL
jgi:transposase-like protein